MSEEHDPSPPSDAAGSSDAGSDPTGSSTPGELGDALGQVMRVALRRGRKEVERAATTGRHRLQLRQLRADRDAMLRKIGKEVLRLVEAEEIDHPGLLRSAGRVAELDAELADLELRRRKGVATDAPSDL